MANSRKSKSDDLIGRATSALAVAPRGASLLLGLSGGVDSVVLLHLLSRLAPIHGWRLSALHVNHGISPRAGVWADFCASLCARLDVPLKIELVDIAPLREMGIEAAARELRHAALSRQQADFIALAHHQDDQAETLLLQLLRGAGVRGASAMPSVKMRHDAPALLRPLLDVPRSELEAYAKAHKLDWVEDESNADVGYPRNFLRHCVFPVLEEGFPAYRETLARSVRHFAETSGLLDELAAQDGGVAGESLEVARLESLSPARAKNLLRYFLHVSGAPMPRAAQLEDMLQQLVAARRDAAVKIEFGGWQLARFKGRAYVFRALGEADRNFNIPWRGEAELALPELGGNLSFEPCVGQGMSLEKLKRGAMTVRLRQGAERIRLNEKRPARTLKNLLQEHDIPPWRRETLPLLYCGDAFVAAPGIGVSCGWQAGQGEPGIVLRWNV